MNQVNFHFFNVNNGDSILVEIVDDKNTFYVVVDTYFIKRNGAIYCPALEYLKSQKAKAISSIIITHFHKDHFTGIEEYFNNFEVHKLCIPPVISRKSSSFDNIIESYKKEIGNTMRRTNDGQILSELESLIFLIDYIKKNEDKVQEIEGKEMKFRIPELNEDIGVVYLPVAKFKGALVKKILDSKFSLNTFPQMNDMSVAICFTLFENRILLTGDSTFNQWREHIRQMKVDGVTNLGINILKASHHGSKNNNSDDIFNYFFKKMTKKKNIFLFLLMGDLILIM